jgi:formylglycine-generating enzyme required for sulfatase activity
MRSRRRLVPACLCLAALLAVAARPAPGPFAPPEKCFALFVEELVPITPGQGKFPASFTMGSSDNDAPATEKPAVKVTFKAGFAMSRYEVTQELYKAVTGKEPSKWPGPRNSVEMANWDEVTSFCEKLTAELHKAKLIPETDVIRLPSEAEWEYCCRAGSTTRYSFGDDAKALGDFAWYKGNAAGNDPPVGKKKPNAWGLYDMHGYVWEWCQDAWAPTHEGARDDASPRVVKDAKDFVVRGGSWADGADAARSAFRAGQPRAHRSDAIGFRCVRSRKE